MAGDSERSYAVRAHDHSEAWESPVSGATVTALDDVGDVTITTVSSGDLLRWNGSAWVNHPDSNYASSGHNHDAAYDALGAAAAAQSAAEATAAADTDADIATHAAIADAHHAKYTDGEAVTAMGVKGNANALNHDRYTDAEAVAATAASYEAAGGIATHAAIVDAHHAKYTDAEAIAAVEGEATLALTGNVTTTGNITAGSGVVSALTVSAERVITEFPLACKLTQGSDQTVSNATDTTATWDAIAYDQGTNWGLSAMADLTNERIYIRRRGLYDIKAQYAFDPSSSGGRVIRIYWYDVSASSATLLAEYEARSEAGARDGTTHVCVEHSFDTADDYIYVEVFQNSGGNLNSVPAKCWFSARYIGDYIT